MIPPPPRSPLFPYTTLFRSGPPSGERHCRAWQRHRSTGGQSRSEEHTSELQSHVNLVCRLLLEKKNYSTTGSSQWWNAQPVVQHGSARVVALSEGKLIAFRDPRGMRPLCLGQLDCFFFIDSATTEIYTLSLHDALPI